MLAPDFMLFDTRQKVRKEEEEDARLDDHGTVEGQLLMARRWREPVPRRSDFSKRLGGKTKADIPTWVYAVSYRYSIGNQEYQNSRLLSNGSYLCGASQFSGRKDARRVGYQLPNCGDKCERVAQWTYFFRASESVPKGTATSDGFHSL